MKKYIFSHYGGVRRKEVCVGLTLASTGHLKGGPRHKGVYPNG